MILEMTEEALAHYGVKGMKWGVRRKSTKGGLHPKEFEKRKKTPGVFKPVSGSQDFKKVQANRKKPVNELTNKQLKAINERMNLEQNYRRLNPTAVQRGERQVKAILSVIGTGVAVYNTLNSPAGKAAVAAGKAAIKR